MPGTPDFKSFKIFKGSSLLIASNYFPLRAKHWLEFVGLLNYLLARFQKSGVKL